MEDIKYPSWPIPSCLVSWAGMSMSEQLVQGNRILSYVPRTGQPGFVTRKSTLYNNKYESSIITVNSYRTTSNKLPGANTDSKLRRYTMTTPETSPTILLQHPPNPVHT